MTDESRKEEGPTEAGPKVAAGATGDKPADDTAADRAASELPALRQPQPDDLLTVANIESDGSTLTLEINQLGDLVHLIGENERTCTLTIAPMRRADFDDLGDFDGF